MSDDGSGNRGTDGPTDDPALQDDSRAHEQGQQGERTASPPERDRIPVATADERNQYTKQGQSAEEPVSTDEEAFGPEPSDRIIEPGSPSLENAIFVVIGAVLMVIIMFRLQSVVGF